MAGIVPNSSGLLTEGLFRASPFTDGDVKVMWPPTAFLTYNCSFIRDVWGTGFGDFTSEYRAPTGWPVPGELVRKPRMVLFEHIWTDFYVDAPLTLNTRMDTWRARRDDAVSEFVNNPKLEILKGPSYMEPAVTYVGGYEGNSQVEWIGVTGSGGLNSIFQRNLRWIPWLLPAADDVNDGFVGLDVLHVVFFKSMGQSSQSYYDLFPADYAADVALWISTHGNFVNHAAHLYLDSTSELPGESAISGSEELAEDEAHLQDVAASLADYGVTYKGQNTLTDSADIISNIRSHFDL